VGANQSHALTLGELLDGDLGLELVAGDGDVRARRIAGAHSIEIDHPATWLGRDWIMLTTGVRLRNSAEAQRQLATELAEIGAAALGFGVEVVFKSVPAALIDEARSRGLPVFTIPLRTPFRDVISAVNTSLLSSEVRAMQRLSSLQLYLIDALEDENPRHVVLERLGGFVDATVTLFSAEGRVIDETGPAPVEAIWREIASRPAALMQFDDDGWETIAIPLRSDPTAGSWLAMSSRSSRPMARPARAAARATAPILAALARVEAMVLAQEGAIESAVLDALLNGDDPDHGSLAARAAAMGIDCATSVGVVVASAEFSTRDARARLRAVLVSVLHRRSLPFLAGARHDACVLLIQASPADMRAAVEEALSEYPGAAAGIGRAVHSVDAVPDSLRDAEIALERTRADPARRVLAVEDLDLATLIATELSSDRLTHKADELVGVLRTNQGLFEAVVAFFEHDLDIMRTSEAMHLHHNSVRYRLGRVEQLLGRSLKDPATIASLYVALAAHGHGRRPS